MKNDALFSWPRDQIFAKGHEFLSFAKNMSKIVGKNLNSKYRQKLLDHARQSAPDVLKDILKAFDDFKNKQKSVWSNVKVCLFIKCTQYTIHWAKTQMSKKIPFEQNKW